MSLPGPKEARGDKRMSQDPDARTLAEDGSAPGALGAPFSSDLSSTDRRGPPRHAQELGLGSPTAVQGPSTEWHEQWSMFHDRAEFLFHEWIAPVTLEDFRGLDVLEGGCGGGQHTALLATVARSVTAVDLNTIDLAARFNQNAANVELVAADLGTMRLGRDFDRVISIGVIHHTDDPDRTFDTLYDHLKPGGRMVIWTYSFEGNALVRRGVEPARRVLLSHLSRRSLLAISKLVTGALYLFTHTIYRLPFLFFLPYFEYFANFRRLSFERNVLNVFDKLNAPQTHFTTRATAERWFSAERFEADSLSIRRYAGVSYSLSGIKRKAETA